MSLRSARKEDKIFYITGLQIFRDTLRVHCNYGNFVNTVLYSVSFL